MIEFFDEENGGDGEWLLDFNPIVEDGERWVQVACNSDGCDLNRQDVLKLLNFLNGWLNGE